MPAVKNHHIISRQDVLYNNGQDGRPFWAVIDNYVVDCTDFMHKHPGGMKKILSANDTNVGWTGKQFGFSLGRGKNSHFSKTHRAFLDGIGLFHKFNIDEEHASTETITVDVVFSDHAALGKIVILGRLESS